MPWTAMTAPAVGEATKKVSFADVVIDNLTYLYANMGGSGSGGSMISNGSFETDADTDGTPDGWTVTELTGSSFALNTATPGHGATAIQFTSPGATGGGYIETTDAFPVSPGKMLIVDFLHKSTVAGVHNLVEVRWYTSSDEGDYIETLTIYDDDTTNPAAWTRFMRIAVPPATALFAKIRLIGASDDDATAGIAHFDGVSVYEGTSGDTRVTMAEVSTGSSDTGTATVSLPTFAAARMMRLTFMAVTTQTVAFGGATVVTWGIGSAAYTDDGSWGGDGWGLTPTPTGPFVIMYYGTGGDETLTAYLSTDTGTVTVEMDYEQMRIEVL